MATIGTFTKNDNGAGFTGAGGTTVAAATDGLTVDQLGDTTYAGSITGLGSFTKVGSGTLTFGGSIGAITVTDITAIGGGLTLAQGGVLSSQTDLVLDDTQATLIAADALATIEHALDCEHVVESAESVGVMQTAFEQTREYLNTRQQYGQYIGQFQALQHRLADMFIELEQARSVVLRGLDAIVRNGPDRSAMAAACRVKVAQAGHYVGAQGIQLHGGIGVTEEYPVGHHFRQLIAFEMRHGGANAQVERYASMMEL